MFFKKKKSLVTGDATYDFGQNYWDSKWAKSPVLYGGRTLKTKNDTLAIDVTEFITTHDVILQEIIKNYNLIKDTPNNTALAIQKWVVSFLQYTDDSVSDGAPEFWQFPFETVQSGVGDCEDGAILTANLLLNAGIPAWRVKVAAGYVRESPTAPQGGHAYCLFLSDDLTDEKKLSWKILDWCYYEDSSVPIEKKPKAKDGGYKGCYGDVWFTFNSEYAWAGCPISVFDGRVSGNQSKDVLNNTKTLSNVMATVARKIKNKK